MIERCFSAQQLVLDSASVFPHSGDRNSIVDANNVLRFQKSRTVRSSIDVIYRRRIFDICGNCHTGLNITILTDNVGLGFGVSDGNKAIIVRVDPISGQFRLLYAIDHQNLLEPNYVGWKSSTVIQPFNNVLSASFAMGTCDSSTRLWNEAKLSSTWTSDGLFGFDVSNNTELLLTAFSSEVAYSTTALCVSAPAAPSLYQSSMLTDLYCGLNPPSSAPTSVPTSPSSIPTCMPSPTPYLLYHDGVLLFPYLVWFFVAVGGIQALYLLWYGLVADKESNRDTHVLRSLEHVRRFFRNVIMYRKDYYMKESWLIILGRKLLEFHKLLRVCSRNHGGLRGRGHLRFLNFTVALMEPIALLAVFMFFYVFVFPDDGTCERIRGSLANERCAELVNALREPRCIWYPEEFVCRHRPPLLYALQTTFDTKEPSSSWATIANTIMEQRWSGVLFNYPLIMWNHILTDWRRTCKWIVFVSIGLCLTRLIVLIVDVLLREYVLEGILSFHAYGEYLLVNTARQQEQGGFKRDKLRRAWRLVSRYCTEMITATRSWCRDLLRPSTRSIQRRKGVSHNVNRVLPVNQVTKDIVFEERSSGTQDLELVTSASSMLTSEEKKQVSAALRLRETSEQGKISQEGIDSLRKPHVRFSLESEKYKIAPTAELSKEISIAEKEEQQELGSSQHMQRNDHPVNNFHSDAHPLTWFTSFIHLMRKRILVDEQERQENARKKSAQGVYSVRDECKDLLLKARELLNRPRLTEELVDTAYFIKRMLDLDDHGSFLRAEEKHNRARLVKWGRGRFGWNRIYHNIAFARSDSNRIHYITVGLPKGLVNMLLLESFLLAEFPVTEYAEGVGRYLFDLDLFPPRILYLSQYIACITVVVGLTVGLAYWCLYYTLVVAHHSNIPDIVLLFISAYSLSLFLVEPTFVYIFHVAISQSLYAELSDVHEKIRNRARTVLHRKFSFFGRDQFHKGNSNSSQNAVDMSTSSRVNIQNICCVTDHFNAACRTAKLFPGLVVSRLILELNDYDINRFMYNVMEYKIQPKEVTEDTDLAMEVPATVPKDVEEQISYIDQVKATMKVLTKAHKKPQEELEIPQAYTGRNTLQSQFVSSLEHALQVLRHLAADCADYSIRVGRVLRKRTVQWWDQMKHRLKCCFPPPLTHAQHVARRVYGEGNLTWDYEYERKQHALALSISGLLLSLPHAVIVEWIAWNSVLLTWTTFATAVLFIVRNIVPKSYELRAALIASAVLMLAHLLRLEYRRRAYNSSHPDLVDALSGHENMASRVEEYLQKLESLQSEATDQLMGEDLFLQHCDVYGYLHDNEHGRLDGRRGAIANSLQSVQSSAHQQRLRSKNFRGAVYQIGNAFKDMIDDDEKEPEIETVAKEAESILSPEVNQYMRQLSSLSTKAVRLYLSSKKLPKSNESNEDNEVAVR